MNGIPGPLTNPKIKKIHLGYIGGARGPKVWSVPPNPFGTFYSKKLSHCKVPVWRGSIFLKEIV
jgi:hypothetical protein